MVINVFDGKMLLKYAIVLLSGETLTAKKKTKKKKKMNRENYNDVRK